MYVSPMKDASVVRAACVGFSVGPLAPDRSAFPDPVLDLDTSRALCWAVVTVGVVRVYSG